MGKAEFESKLYSSIDTLSGYGLKVKEVKRLDLTGKDGCSTIFGLKIIYAGNLYPIRVDHAENAQEETITVWCSFGKFKASEISHSQTLWLNTWWHRKHPQSSLRIVRSNQGEIILGTKRSFAEFSEDSLSKTISTLVCNIPQVSSQIRDLQWSYKHVVV